MEHTHADTHLHVTTCDRCAREWEVRRATDPLFVAEDVFPPSDTLPRRLWNLLVPVRLRIALYALLRRLGR
jgi:hypothetical protein